MILEKLQLRDFRCYSGFTEINFSIDPEKNTTVIQGTNGAGKTSILQALNFALYGPGIASQDLESPLISNAALKDSHSDKLARTNVTLSFKHDGLHYQLSRTLHGFLESGRVRYVSRPEDLYLKFKTADGNTDNDGFPQQSIERMLPSPIRTFFLFDGDRIAEFTRPGRERDEKIRRAVNDVLHMEALSRAADRTAKIATEKRKQLEKTGAPAVQKITIEIQQQETEVERKRGIAADLQREIAALSARITEIDAELISFSEVAKLAGQRRDLDKRREGLMERSKQLRDHLGKATIAAIPALVSPTIANTVTTLEKHKTRHEIPARIADYFLRELIQNEKCICNRPIVAGTPERLELEQLLKSLLPNSLQDQATELLNHLRPLGADSSMRVDDVLEVMKAIQTNDNEITRIDKELERIGGDIDAKAYDRSIELNKERVRGSSLLMDYKEKIGLAERDAVRSAQVKRVLEERLKSEFAKRAGIGELQREWTVARDCADALQQARAILDERLRASLGAEATDILRKLASDAKSYFFSQIKIDPNFLLRVLDQDGRDVRPQLSMGETQVSSLAFMLAMTRLGGQEAPLVVDTPLARLDVSVRSHAAHWLPELAPQLVLLVTDAEFESDVEKELQPVLGKRMRLVPGPDGTKVEVIV